jgi:2'-5' RNA ligase
MTSENMMRTFVALAPPKDVLEKIIALQTRLKKKIPHGIRWVHPDGIHLTLKFLGDIFPSHRDSIASLLSLVVSSHSCFPLSVGRIGVFPGIARPRVMWVGIGGQTRLLAALQQHIEEALESVGFPKETRPFRAHLTLGRIRNPGSFPNLGSIIAQEQNFDAGTFNAQKLLFIQSNLTPTGAIYTCLASFPLSAKPLSDR